MRHINYNPAVFLLATHEHAELDMPGSRENGSGKEHNHTHAKAFL
jgi:hypothetical protein